MIGVWVFGLALVFTPGIVVWSEVWPWTKAAAVLGERFGFDLLSTAGDAEPQPLLADVRQLVQRRFLDETRAD